VLARLSVEFAAYIPVNSTLVRCGPSSGELSGPRCAT
jgi:hypothetical protein